MAIFGINLNNRAPLLARHYSLERLLELAQAAEELGLHSVWVGDSLFSKPRYDPLVLLASISQRTSHLRLGTACLVTATRNPLYLAMQWATLDVLSGGRTILGACMSNPEEGVRREYMALGLDFSKRAEIFEEGLAVLRQLLTSGQAHYSGQHFNYQDIAFYSGTELRPLTPIQRPPPIWVVSNPRILYGPATTPKLMATLERGTRRIAQYGDGWLTCCRALHPDEFAQQRQMVVQALASLGRSAEGFTMAYQVTLNIGASQEAAQSDMADYIAKYYPELTSRGAVHLSNWGPAGTPEQVIEWFKKFSAAGVNYFICRFGATDPMAQLKRFAEEVLPALAAN